MLTTTTTVGQAPPNTTNGAEIQNVTAKITYYSPIILLTLGIFGCLCNFITFTDPQLRKSSCAFYFLTAAVFELLSITFGLISRFAADHLGSTLINTDQAYCKLRAYLVSAVPLAATYLVLLSSIDRCLSSSVNARLRSFSQIKMAYRAVAVAVAVAFLSCIHILIGYDLRPRCGALAGVFAMYDSMFVVFWLGVIPHVLMLIFGLFTYINIKQSKRRVGVLSTKKLAALYQQSRRELKTEKQLVIMMLFQVGFSALLILTRMIYYAYYVLAPPLVGYDRLVGSFLMSFTTQLYYLNYVKSFYIYTLSSRLFRTIFVSRVKSSVLKLCRRNVLVLPYINTVNNGQTYTQPVKRSTAPRK